MNEKPCTQEEINAYFEFASLSLQERRRRVFEKMIEVMPDSPFVRDLLTGRIEMPKRRGRKPIAMATKSKARKAPVTKGRSKTTRSTIPTKVTLPVMPQRLIEDRDDWD